MSYIVLVQSGLHYETLFQKKKNQTHTHMHTHIFVSSFKHYLQRRLAGAVGTYSKTPSVSSPREACAVGQ